MSQTTINFIAGGIGGFVSYAYGGWSGVLELLLICIALDYLTGFAAAWKEKKLNSEIGFWGLIKKVLMLLAVMLGHRADMALGLNDVIMTGMVFAFLANELLSIAENYGRLGLPMSEHIRPILDVLKKKGGGDKP